MSYTEDIAKPLIDTLTRTAGLPKFQLAGHVPNLAFWMKEARHAIEVIDGYPKRFDALAAAQSAFELVEPVVNNAAKDHEYKYKPLNISVSPALAKTLRNEIQKAAGRLVERCLKEELIDIVKADDLKEAVGTV